MMMMAGERRRCGAPCVSPPLLQLAASNCSGGGEAVVRSSGHRPGCGLCAQVKQFVWPVLIGVKHVSFLH